MELLSSESILNKFKEKTNALCYYIIKSVLLWNISEFTKWCKKNNYSSIEFTKTQKNQESFIELIKENYRKKGFINELDENMNILENMNKTDYVYNTLRMTVFG